MARFTIDEIGNVPLAPDEISQEAVELFTARNPPGNALIIRSNAAREAYGYAFSSSPGLRKKINSMNVLFCGNAPRTKNPGQKAESALPAPQAFPV